MTDLLSPASQIDGVDSLKPATPAEAVPLEPQVHLKDQEEANIEKPAR
jgi:hypothetical protein